MSDGAISQDEIDALLSGVAVDGLNSSGHVGNGPNYHIDYKFQQLRHSTDHPDMPNEPLQDPCLLRLCIHNLSVLPENQEALG